MDDNPVRIALTDEYTLNGEKIPPIFCKENRAIWVEVRRFLIWLCRKIGEYYDLDHVNI